MTSLNADFSQLIEAVVDVAGQQAGESLREPIAELRQRLSAIERRLAILENIERNGAQEFDPLARSAEHICQYCDRRAIARSLCSAHYQQWRYRQKKAKLRASLGGGHTESPDTDASNDHLKLLDA